MCLNISVSFKHVSLRDLFIYIGYSSSVNWQQSTKWGSLDTVIHFLGHVVKKVCPDLHMCTVTHACVCMRTQAGRCTQAGRQAGTHAHTHTHTNKCNFRKEQVVSWVWWFMYVVLALRRLRIAVSSRIDCVTSCLKQTYKQIKQQNQFLQFSHIRCSWNTGFQLS